MTQPKALFLADVIESDRYVAAHHGAAAAELRRLSAVEAQRDALLEALKPFVTIGSGFDMDDVWRARAAIKAMEEEK